jgi:hypothetical protein
MPSLSNLFLFAQTWWAEAGASGGASSAAWALVIFLVILGMLVTLASSRRTIEIKRQKEE